MKDDNRVNEHMIRARPRLKVDPAFTARVMEAVRTTRQRRIVPWRMLTVAMTVLLVAVGAGTFMFINRNAAQVAATDSSNNSAASQQSSDQKSTTHYQELATSAQSDINSLSEQTGNFSDNDYADTQLADSAIY